MEGLAPQLREQVHFQGRPSWLCGVDPAFCVSEHLLSLSSLFLPQIQVKFLLSCLICSFTQQLFIGLMLSGGHVPCIWNRMNRTDRLPTS